MQNEEYKTNQRTGAGTSSERTPESAGNDIRSADM